MYTRKDTFYTLKKKESTHMKWHLMHIDRETSNVVSVFFKTRKKALEYIYKNVKEKIKKRKILTSSEYTKYLEVILEKIEKNPMGIILLNEITNGGWEKHSLKEIENGLEYSEYKKYIQIHTKI